MATSEVTKPQDDDATRGLTLRELVLEVRGDLKTVGRAFEGHLVDHAETRGRARGEAHIFGIARSTVAVAASGVSIFVAVWSLVH